MPDILGQALSEYFHHQSTTRLWINNTYGPKEEMPVSVYFRKEDELSDLEWLALEQCRGGVLDIGAGAGSHTLILQERSFDVKAIDTSAGAVEIMKVRGVKDVHEKDIYQFQEGYFDTLLLMMNGIGLAGNLNGLETLLHVFKKLLNPGGQVLFDSSDVSYLQVEIAQNKDQHEADLDDQQQQNQEEKYVGEISYQYQYKKMKSEWFQWLYIDESLMKKMAGEAGFEMEVLLEDEFGQYLARLYRMS